MRLLNPFSELFELHMYMNDLIDEVSGRSTEKRCAARYSVPVDVMENDAEFVVKLDLPGYKREDIDVLMHESNIEISAERPAENDMVYTSRERTTGRINRTIEFGIKIDPELMKATYLNGVLTVYCPKRADVKPRQIPISE